jgi:hypothetical protein
MLGYDLKLVECRLHQHVSCTIPGQRDLMSLHDLPTGL